MNSTNNPPVILPPRLKKGDTIGIAAPAGPILDHGAFFNGVKQFESHGLTVVFSESIFEKEDYLAGNDRCRTDEFLKLWADPDVKAIVAARGGFGTIRLLENIDFAFLKSTPKMLVGFSDLTVLLNAIQQQTGLCRGQAFRVGGTADGNDQAINAQ